MNVPKIAGEGSDLATKATDRCSLFKHQQTHASLDSLGRNYDRTEQKAQSLEKGRLGLRPNLLWGQRSKQIFHSQKPIPLGEMHKRANSGDPLTSTPDPSLPPPLSSQKKFSTHLFAAQIPKMLAADLYTCVYVGSETKTDKVGEKKGIKK